MKQAESGHESIIHMTFYFRELEEIKKLSASMHFKLKQVLFGTFSLVCQSTLT